MAIRVPTYRDPQVRQQGLPSVFQNVAAPAEAFGGATARAMSNFGTAAQQLGTEWSQREINLQQENNQLYALQLHTEAEREMSDFLYNPDTGLMTKKGRNALNAPQETAKKLEEIQKRYNSIKDVPDYTRSMLQRGMIQMGRRYGDLAQRHALGEYNTYKEQTLQSKLDLNMQDIAMNYMDDKEFQAKATENFELIQSRAKSEGWSDEKLEAEKLRTYSAMRGTQITSMIASDEPQNILVAQQVYKEARNRNQIGFKDSLQIEALLDKAVPKAAAMVAFQRGRMGASVSDESGVIDYVIDQMEGGEAIAQEPGGAIAKYGINSAAHPSVDVANLSREGARDIYKKQYWDSYGIGEVPENMRLLAFDIAVNHRSDFAKQQIDKIKAGEMPDQILNNRLKEYQRLRDTNPDKYARYYNGWTDRLNRISTQMSSDMPVEPQSIYTAARQLDTQYKGAGAELIALYENNEKSKAAAKKAEHDQMQDMVTDLNSKNNGDYTKIPSIIRARAAELGIDVTQYKGVSDPDVKAELDAMSSSELYAADLNSPRYAQNLTYADRQSYQKKQGDLEKPDSKYMGEMVDGAVDYYFRSQGNARAYDPNDKKNKQEVASMRNYVNYRVEVERVAGRDVTKQNVMKFASDYIANKKNTRIRDMFSIDPVEREQIEKQLISMNLTPTPEAVWAVYNGVRNDIAAPRQQQGQ